MAEANDRTDQQDRTAGAGRAPAAHPAIDIQQVADRVYRLLLAEARLARARGERPGPAKRS